MLRKLPNWANDPPSGYPGAIAPLAGKRSEGWDNGEEPLAGHVNYVIQAASDASNEVANTIEGLGGTLGADLTQLFTRLSIAHHKLALSCFTLAEDTGAAISGFAKANDISVAVGASGSIQRLVLESGGKYQMGGFAADTPAASYAGNFNAIAYGAGKFAAIGASEEIQTSAGDGVWTRRRTGTKTLRSIVFGGGKFVATGADGRIVYSTDGETWTVATSAITDDLVAVVYVGGRFVACTDTSAIVHSLDGITWTVAFDDNQVSGSGNLGASPEMGFFYNYDGQLRHSVDGVTWSEIQTYDFPSMGLLVGAFFWALVLAEASGTRVIGYTSVEANAASAFTLEFVHSASMGIRLIDGQYWGFSGTEIYVGGAV